MDNFEVNQDRQKWERRVNESRTMLKQFHDEWVKNYRAVYGKDWMKDGQREQDGTTSTTKQQPYTFDLLLAYMKTELPALILYRPEIFLTATEEYAAQNPQAEQEAKLYQSECNSILNDLDGFEQETKAILADGHCAFGVAKVLHNPSFTTETNEFGMEIERMTGDKFELSRVNPFKFLIDSRCKNDPTKARWQGEDIDRTLDELDKSGLYDSKKIEKLRAAVKQNDKDDWEIDVKITEIYDMVDRKLIVLCDDLKDDFLRYEDMPESINDGTPYCILKFNEIPGQFVPKPEISSGRQMQDDQKDLRQWLKKLAKKSVPKLGVKPDRLEAEEEKKLTDGVSDIVKIQNEGDVFPINNDLKFGTAPKEYFEVSTRDFDEIMGQSSQDRGITGGAKFATEAEIAEQQSKLRESDKLNTVRVWLEQMIEKLLQLMKHGGYAKLKQLPLDVDLNIEVDIESKSPKSKALDRKQLTEVLTIIAQNPIFMQSQTLLDQILRDYDLREKDKIIAELQAAMQAQAEASKPEPVAPENKGINLSLSLKHELLPPEAVDRIVDMIMQADIPIASSTPSFPPTGGAGSEMASPDQSVAAGTEGMEPGSGMMPSGEIV